MMTVLPSGHITLAVSRIRCASQSFSTPRTTNPVANTGTAPEIGSRTGYIVPWGIQVSMRESVEDHASTYVVRDCVCGFSAGTRGSHGTMISTRDVLSDTGPDTCGPCGSHVLHNSPSITSTIATLPHPRGCIMVAGALCTFPSQATLGDIFRSTSTYASSENDGTLHVHVNVYLYKYRPVTDSNGKISTVPGRHHQSYLDLRLGNPPGFLKMSQLASPRRALS